MAGMSAFIQVSALVMVGLVTADSTAFLLIHIMAITIRFLILSGEVLGDMGTFIRHTMAMVSMVAITIMLGGSTTVIMQAITTEEIMETIMHIPAPMV